VFHPAENSLLLKYCRYISNGFS